MIERRSLPERRTVGGRRTNDRRVAALPVQVERRIPWEQRNEIDRHSIRERRTVGGRRTGTERRTDYRRVADSPVASERRSGLDRRLYHRRYDAWVRRGEPDWS